MTRLWPVKTFQFAGKLSSNPNKTKYQAFCQKHEIITPITQLYEIDGLRPKIGLILPVFRVIILIMTWESSEQSNVVADDC